MNHRIAFAGLTVAAAVLAPSAAHAADRIVPVDEGGDSQHCVTYAEYEAISFGSSRGQVRRTFDTDGHRVDRATMDAILGALPVAPGYEVSRPSHLMDRIYHACVDDLNPNGGTIVVEFNIRTDSVTASAWT